MHRMIPTLPIVRQLSVWKISVKIQWIEEFGIQGVSQPLECKPNSFRGSTGFSKAPILTKYEAHNMGYTGIVLASYVNSHYNCTIRNFPFFTGLAMPVNGGVNPILFVDQLVSPGPHPHKNMGYRVLDSSVHTILFATVYDVFLTFSLG